MAYGLQVCNNNKMEGITLDFATRLFLEGFNRGYNKEPHHISALLVFCDGNPPNTADDRWILLTKGQ